MADSFYFQLSRYSQPALILFGTIGAVINQTLFYCRKPLRSTSCSLYFRALSSNDLLVLYIVVFPSWYATQFGSDPSKQFSWYCKIKTYLGDSLYTLSPYLIVLACFDRLCTSSTSARWRSIATIRMASFLIPTTIVLIFLAYVHVPIWYDLLYYPTTSFCYSASSTYIKIVSLFILMLLCIIPPVLMSLICTTTLLLLRKQRRRIMPTNQARVRQRDAQVLKMLYIYVATHIIFTVPFAVTYVVLVFGPSDYSPVLLSLFRIFSLLLNANFATSFYIYTLCTPFYRQELRKLLRTGRERLFQSSTQVISGH